MTDIRDTKALRKEGARLGRAGLSERVIQIINEFDGTYIGAMVLVGRMRAIATAAGYDAYWSEKVGHGFHGEMIALSRTPTPEVKIGE
jgi:hypothetical protein